MTPDEVVTNFCACWERGDVEAILDGLAPDATYHNMPMDPLNGHEEIRGFLEGFLASSPGGIAFEIRNQVSSGNLVMNERVDTLTMNGTEVALPVMGTFEVSGDKITAWRDYFDMTAFTGG